MSSMRGKKMWLKTGAVTWHIRIVTWLIHIVTWLIHISNCSAFRWCDTSEQIILGIQWILSCTKSHCDTRRRLWCTDWNGDDSNKCLVFEGISKNLKKFSCRFLNWCMHTYYAHIYICICIWIYVYICICIYECLYIYTYTYQYI